MKTANQQLVRMRLEFAIVSSIFIIIGAALRVLAMPFVEAVLQVAIFSYGLWTYTRARRVG